MREHALAHQARQTRQEDPGADGQVQTQFSAGDSAEIRRSDRAVRLLRLVGSSFFETLRQKLHWSGSNV